MPKHTYPDGFSIISSKSPVVATHMGSFNVSSAQLTFERYQTEALTYVRPVEIATYQQRFLEKVLSKKTAIGCIVAPFGYGKTSTAIDTWKACEQSQVLAVPPFSCTSLAEMGQAIATGVAYRLGVDSQEARQVNQAYDTYITSSAQRLAKNDADQYQIDFDIALRSIEDKIERGYLNIEATSNHLLIFLEQITQLVQEAGYRGLLVIVDEFQQFLGNINKAVITNFRTLIWGLRTRGEVPLGLLITMDPDTERNLSDRAGDILHRIKEDGLYLDFSDSYDRDFARLLWTQYIETFHYSEESSRIVDNATLEALGQICERHDLSNGPRTVIDVFQRIAKVFPERRQPYSPIDLIDDFTTGAIRFDGDRSKIASLVTELTSYEYVKASSERLRTLKLISAFPRGCPRVVAENYGLSKSYDQLSDDLRGEVLTELPEGMALIDLLRVGKPQNKLNILLKKYWMQITEDEIIADRAMILFQRYAVAPMFPPFHNILSGFSTSYPDFTLTSSGSYQQIYEGTFFEEYPQRRICIQTCRSPEQAVPLNEPVDIHIIFILQRLTETPIKPSFDREKHTFTLSLILDRPFGMQLPRETRWIEDYLRPVVLSPGVLLSLIDYINTQSPKIEGITQNELQRIAAYQQKLTAFLIAMIYGEELFTGLKLKIVSRGEQAFRSAIYQTFQQCYTSYQTLITSPQWETQLCTYAKALESVGPVHSQGVEQLAEPKVELAARFGLRNHAGFESYIRQFGLLLTLETWSGDQGSIRFNRHPGENWLLNTITLNRGVDEGKIIEGARGQGYLAEEIRFLIQFLEKRGYIEYESKSGHYIPAQTYSQGEIIRLANEILEEVKELQAITNLPAGVETINQVQRAIASVSENKPNLQGLAEAQVRLLQARQTSQQARYELVRYLQQDLVRLRSTLFEKLTILQQSLPLSQTGLSLDAHVNGAQRTLEAKNGRITSQLSKTIAAIKQLLSQTVEASTDQMLNAQVVSTLRMEYINLVPQIGSIQAEAQDALALRDLHTGWVQLVDRLRRIHEYISLLQGVMILGTFPHRYDVILGALMEGLSVDGMPFYNELYNQYHPQVEDLYAEVSTAIQAAELARSQATDKIPNHAQVQKVDPSSAYEEILNQACQQEVTFARLVKACKLPPNELQRLLIELEGAGKISIYFHVDGEAHS